MEFLFVAASGRIDDEFVVQFFKEKLHSKPCQNQGFVLDGYPKTYDQAKALFVPGNILTYIFLQVSKNSDISSRSVVNLEQYCIVVCKNALSIFEHSSALL